MSEDKSKKEDKQKVAEEKAADVKVEKGAGKAEKAADVRVDDKKEKTAEAKSDKGDEKPGKAEVKKAEPKVKGLEELPEDIKKKLEKKKPEGAKKAKKSKKVAKKKKKIPRRVTVGKAYIKATYNNTIVTLTDVQGNVLSWASAGIAGFKGPKKSTPYAAQIIARIAVGKAREEYGLEEVSVFVKGVGTGRESAVRALNNNGLQITNIKDVTPMPHNGCRPRKPRRV